MHHSSSHNKTFGEALVALVALIGFIALLWQGTITTWQDIWFYCGILAIIVVFYFFMLLAKAIHFFMTNTNSDPFWWEKYEAHQPAKKKK